MGAWIESHQVLREHPKVVRLARLLGVPRPHAVGHLHFLWWWALDHAEDGDVSDFDAMDLADAAGWEGDPEVFVKALIECGPGARDGLLVQSGNRVLIHDWWDYAGKLISRRKVDRERKAAGRQGGSDLRVHRTSDGSPGESEGSPYVTEQNRTEQNQEILGGSASPTRPDVEMLCTLMADLIESNGCRRPTITLKWQTECRLLLDRDAIPQAEVERVLRWTMADDFWKTNVLSMPKFRKQFDRLCLASNRNGHTTTRDRNRAILDAKRTGAR